MEKDNGFIEGFHGLIGSGPSGCIKPREGDGRIGSGPSGGIKPEHGDCKPIQGD